MVRKKAGGEAVQSARKRVIKETQAAIARELAAQSEVPKSVPQRIADLVRELHRRLREASQTRDSGTDLAATGVMPRCPDPPPCCARAISGHAAAALPRKVINSRRRMSCLGRGLHSTTSLDDGGVVRRSKIDHRMAEMGQKHVLPQCNNDGRFASISGPHVGKYYVRCRRDGLAVMERLRLWPRKGRG
jgi:hypothetical protein